ncbi:NAD(P)-binding protein [Nemania sp. NC0429]|nr:NAD(P)-binding protein [Nemania sp. NC0429]
MDAYGNHRDSSAHMVGVANENEARPGTSEKTWERTIKNRALVKLVCLPLYGHRKMASLHIDEGSIPTLDGKVAIVTGGSSGIGLATVKLMLSKGAVVHNLDQNEPIEADWQTWPNLHYHKCDVASFASQRAAFDAVGPAHMVFANAGALAATEFFADALEPDGTLAPPDMHIIDVNFKGVFFTVKLAWSTMRRHKIAGSIVLTASSSGYVPEAGHPTYCALKTGLIGLVRALRNDVVADGITINAVAPSAVYTPLAAPHLGPWIATGLPILATPELVALALAYSATAKQDRRVAVYGKEREADLYKAERWNGRIIFVMGDKFTEIEQPMSDLRPFWLGMENDRLVKLQQAVTDTRQGVGLPRS